MANVMVWKFDSPGGATGAASRLDTLAVEGAGQVIDGAVLEWGESRRTPHVAPFRGRSQQGALGGKFWTRLGEVLSGGSQSAEFAASLAAASFDDQAIARIRAEITQGSSALFLVAEGGGDRSRVLEAFGGASRYVHLIHSNLPHDEEQQLRAAFTKP
jgi:uncharacterized membrane protein